MIDRFRVYTATETVQHGEYCLMRDWAAEEWHDTKLNPQDLPVRPDSRELMRWPIAAQWGSGYPRTVWYYDGYFRNANGTTNSLPVRWAYFRMAPEAWDGQKWTLPDGTLDPVVVPSLRAGIGALMPHYTPQEIMDEMDRWEALNAPGAPE